MSKFTALLPKIALWVLSILSVAATAMIFIGGVIDPSVEYKEPVYTDILLYWIIIMFALALVTTLGFALAQFIRMFANKPGKTLKSLVWIVLLAGIFVVTYMTGDDTPIEILGYDGNQNQGVWLLITNMFCATIGILTAIALLLMAFGGILKPKVKDN